MILPITKPSFRHSISWHVMYIMLWYVVILCVIAHVIIIEHVSHIEELWFPCRSSQQIPPRFPAWEGLDLRPRLSWRCHLAQNLALRQWTVFFLNFEKALWNNRWVTRIHGVLMMKKWRKWSFLFSRGGNYLVVWRCLKHMDKKSFPRSSNADLWLFEAQNDSH